MRLSSFSEELGITINKIYDKRRSKNLLLFRPFLFFVGDEWSGAEWAINHHSTTDNRLGRKGFFSHFIPRRKNPLRTWNHLKLKEWWQRDISPNCQSFWSSENQGPWERRESGSDWCQMQITRRLVHFWHQFFLSTSSREEPSFWLFSHAQFPVSLLVF